MGNRDGNSRQYPTGILGSTPTGKLGRGDGNSRHRNDLKGLISKGIDLQVNDLEHPRRLSAVADDECLDSFIREEKPAKRAGRNRPNRTIKADFSGFNLRNPNDLFSAHQCLVGLGLIDDGHDGLRRVVLAAVIALRLADRNPHGYFAKILHDGYGQYGVADQDHDQAKRIMREVLA